MPTESDSTPPAHSELATQRLRATAFHEAGHAVMAMIVGRPVQKLTIAPGNLQTGGIRLGACEMKKGKAKASNDWLEDSVLILLAGMVAEAHFTGEYCQRGATQDLLAVRQLLNQRAGNARQLERLQRRLLDKTEHLLADEPTSQAIERIAEELLLKTTISGRAVQYYFDQITHDS
jgi:ATP-dependent Zn protease